MDGRVRRLSNGRERCDVPCGTFGELGLEVREVR